MDGLRVALASAAVLAVLWVAGLRALRGKGSRREKVAYTVLLAWSGYIFLSKQMEWPPFTPAELSKLFMPIGTWLEQMVMGTPPAG